MPCDGRARDGRRNKRARTLSPAPECRPRRSRSGKVDREQRTKDSPRRAGLGPSLLALTGIPASEIVPRRDHDPLLPFSSFCSDELLNGRVKNVFTLWPKAVAPSRTFSHAVFAWGLAASPASLIFSPAVSAPPTTVLPMPFAVSATPSPTCLAPLSTCLAPCLALESSVAFESSAARADPGASSASVSSRAVRLASAFIFDILLSTSVSFSPLSRGRLFSRVDPQLACQRPRLHR